jgi:hypothetical protein
MITTLLANACDTIGFLPNLYNNLRDDTGPIDAATKLPNTCANLKLDNFSAITQLLVNVVQIALTLAGLLAVGFIIFGAAQFILSQGEPEKIKKGKETIINSVIGLFLVILSFLIVTLISNAFSGPIK